MVQLGRAGARLTAAHLDGVDIELLHCHRHGTRVLSSLHALLELIMNFAAGLRELRQRSVSEKECRSKGSPAGISELQRTRVPMQAVYAD
jgi:hypothetical protein